MMSKKLKHASVEFNSWVKSKITDENVIYGGVYGVLTFNTSNVFLQFNTGVKGYPQELFVACDENGNEWEN